jgi:hypothetical protein
VQIIAGIFLFSFVFTALIPLIHMPLPVILFGQRIPGVGGRVLFLVSGVLLGIAGIGLLKLKKWSYPLVLVVQGVWLLSGMVSAFSPNYAGFGN